MAITVRHDEQEAEGSFILMAGDQPSGELHYQLEEGNKMIIDHTEVDDSLSGQGAGKKLLEEAVTFARESNLKVVPRCSYAAVMFRRTTDWEDVLHK
jgi:uncharacterized protein